MNTIDRVLEVITGVIERPTANLTLTVLLLAALTLAFLVIDVAVLLLVSPRRKRRVRKTIRRWIPDAPSGAAGGTEVATDDAAANTTAARDDEPSAGEGPVGAGSGTDASTMASPEPDDVPPEKLTGAPTTRRAWWRAAGLIVSAALVPMLILGSLLATYFVTGVDAVCTESCHTDSAAVARIHENDHRYRASCIACHEQGSGADLITAVTSRGAMMLAKAGLSDTPTSRPVASAACLRCHEGVLEGVLESSRVNIRMAHGQPVRSGMDCADCHGAIGHLGEAGRVSVSMDLCLACHDGDTAPTDCGTCHTTDIAAVGRDSLVSDETHITGSGKYQYPPVQVATRDCGGCHDLAAQCDPCHGTRLPHPERFVQGYHAQEAAWSKKEACFRCHREAQDCQQCHAPFNTGHPDSWVRDHQTAGWDAGCGCHGRGTNVDIPICVFCHDDAPSQTVGEEHITRP
ncbi:MAG: cytochrome c3 family protein [Coriobacteriia bacterium]